jgi:hypothetical protein
MVETVEMEIAEGRAGNWRIAAGTTGLTGDSGSSVRTFVEIEAEVAERAPIPSEGKVRQFAFDRGPKSRSYIEIEAPQPGENVCFQVDKGGRRLRVGLAGDKELETIVAAFWFIAKTLTEKTEKPD